MYILIHLVYENEFTSLKRQTMLFKKISLSALDVSKYVAFPISLPINPQNSFFPLPSFDWNTNAVFGFFSGFRNRKAIHFKRYSRTVSYPPLISQANRGKDGYPPFLTQFSSFLCRALPISYTRWEVSPSTPLPFF